MKLSALILLFLVGVSAQAQNPTFGRDIYPILKESCIKCHGAEKQKGEIRLDSADQIRESIRSKSIIVKGNPEKSPFYKLTVLHPDDEDRMPQKGKGSPLSKDQTTTLWVWITQGADFGDGKPFMVGQNDPAQTVNAAGKTRNVGTIPPPRMTVDPAIVEALRPYQIVVTAYGHHGYGMSLRFVNPEKFETAFEQLRPYADKVWHLDLSRQAAGRSHLESLQAYPNLARLDLRENSYSIDDLAVLKNLKHLEWLNLAGSKINGDIAQLQATLNPQITLYLP